MSFTVILEWVSAHRKEVIHATAAPCLFIILYLALSLEKDDSTIDSPGWERVIYGAAASALCLALCLCIAMLFNNIPLGDAGVSDFLVLHRNLLCDVSFCIAEVALVMMLGASTTARVTRTQEAVMETITLLFFTRFHQISLGALRPPSNLSFIVYLTIAVSGNMASVALYFGIGAGFCCLWLVLLAVDIRCHLSKESQLSELQRMCLKVVLANAIAMAAIAAANCVAITQGESLLVTVKAVGISLLLSYIVLVLLRSMTMLAVEVATLQAQQKAQGSFIRYICHECRNPLHSCDMSLQLLAREQCGCEAVDAMGGRCVHEACYLLLGCTRLAVSVLDDALSFERLKLSAFDLRLETFCLRNTVEAVVGLLRPCALTKEALIITQHNTNSSVLVRADPNKFRQVVHNLISNALKFIPDSGTITVSTSAMSAKQCHEVFADAYKPNEKAFHDLADNVVVVDVKDTGCGIAPEDQERLFLTFAQVRAHETQNGGGNGLGLMICKTIVEAHGGCTVLRSELGKGSCFSIILRASPPGIPESVPELMVRASSTTTFTRALNWSFKTSSKVNPANVRPHCVKPEGCGDNTDRSFTTSPDSEPGANCVAGREPLKPTGPVVQHLKGLRALIVDDSALNRRLLGAGLQRDGVQVTDAADGLEAVEMTIASMGSRCPFHVIFMDYTMERLDGPSATRRIRQELGFIGMILGVTGNVSQVDKDSFLSAGANDVLGKPVDFGTIRSILLPIAGAVAAAKERLFLSTV